MGKYLGQGTLYKEAKEKFMKDLNSILFEGNLREGIDPDKVSALIKDMKLVNKDSV